MTEERITSTELKEDLLNRRNTDRFYDVDDEFIDMLVQDHEIVDRLREQLNILEIRFKQAYFPSKRRGKTYRRIKWIKRILGELELQKIMENRK